MNVDSIQLFSFYTTNPGASNAVISYYQQNADTLSQFARQLHTAGISNTDSAVNAIAPYISQDAIMRIDSALAALRRQNTSIATPEVLDNAAARAEEDSMNTAKKNGSAYGSKTITVDSTSKRLTHNPAADTLQILSKTFLAGADSLRKEANLPIGFQYSIFKQPVSWFYPFFLKILGILISGLAASFGGPFWFDVLRKIYTRK